MSSVFRRRNSESTLILPTGDGMAIGFNDSPEKPLLLSIELHNNLQRYNSTKREKERLFIRIGLDSGPIYLIKDLNGKENVWGPRIIMARPVMDLARSMNIITSARIANDVRSLRPEYKSILHAAGDYLLKHGNKGLLYNVYGEGFGNKRQPSEGKIEKSRVEEEVIKSVNMLFHNRAELKLEIIDPVNMITHHRTENSFTRAYERWDVGQFLPLVFFVRCHLRNLMYCVYFYAPLILERFRIAKRILGGVSV